jgi:hypothetical protein
LLKENDAMTINNDSEFKATLNGLPANRQRQVAARFAKSVLVLSKDARVKHAIDSVTQKSLSDDELDSAYKSAKAASVDSFTRCGSECNWNDQAGHFVAQAALACIKPGDSPAWDAAMYARMARTSESIATGIGTDNAETVAQYRILEKYLAGE